MSSSICSHTLYRIIFPLESPRLVKFQNENQLEHFCYQIDTILHMQGLRCLDLAGFRSRFAQLRGTLNWSIFTGQAPHSANWVGPVCSSWLLMLPRMRRKLEVISAEMASENRILQEKRRFWYSVAFENST